MRLRAHPKLSGKWPPTWTPRLSGTSKKPRGEQPDKLLSVRELEGAITLDVQFEGERFGGYLAIEDIEFRKRLLKVLNKSLYRTLRQVGSTDVDF
ncbi:MAG: hypothetical protein PVJ69_08540 [Desulfobacteraceae bacterium]|jgi:hypothetical protein